MNLAEALDLRAGEMVSLIGAGGKTTTLFRLAKDLRDSGGKILVTTTTRIFKPAKPHVDRLFLVEDVDAFLSATAKIQAPVIVGAGHNVDDEGKLVGLPLAWLDQLAQSRQFDSILVEADSAKSRLFKVPSETEPLVPKDCHLTVWIMAIKAMGKPMNSDWIDGAERAISTLGVPAEAPLTKERIVQLVQHPLGCLKGIPPASRKIALLNQMESPEEIETAEDLARSLVRLGLDKVVVAGYLNDAAVREVISK
jgi:molybdenum cofactor cytidylyltransferase